MTNNFLIKTGNIIDSGETAWINPTSRMIKVMMTIIAAMLMVIATPVFASNVHHVLWNKNIIPVQIPIGKEKIIEVCAPNSNSNSESNRGDASTCQTIPLTPYLPQAEIKNGDLKWINNNGTLYLNATKPFSKKLAELKLNNKNGDVVLIRLSATKAANDDQIQILLPSKSRNSLSANNTSNATNNTTNSPRNKAQQDKSIGDMVRWVAQQLYAPKRLLTAPTWIYRVPMHTNKFIALYRGGVVSSMPLASWRAGDYYITAVLLRNVLKNTNVHLKYTMLRGQWIAATFFRQSRLNPAILTKVRTISDSTTAILVSTVPFNAALREASKGEVKNA